MSPDGASIAFTSSRSERWDTDTIRDIHLVPVDGGVPTILTASDGTCDAPSWSPDGSCLAFLYSPERLDDYPRHAQVAVLDRATKRRIILTASLDRHCAPYPSIREPVWDGEDLLFAVEDRGNTHLYRVSADGAEAPECVVGGELAVTAYDAAGGEIVHAESTPTSPPRADPRRSSHHRRRTRFRDGRELVRPEGFAAVSPDGSEWTRGSCVRPAFSRGAGIPCS